MSINTLNLYAGLSELDLEDVVEEINENTDAAIEEVRAEVAEIALEVEETADNVEDLVETVEELEETAEEIEDAVEGMESLLASGSYNSVAFSHLYARAAKGARKLSGQAVVGSRLGAESLTDAATAEMLTRQGIESFMDTVKNWGKKAIEFIKHIFNTIINFFVGIFDKASAMHRRAEQLEKRLKDGTTIKKEVNAGGWTSYFDPKGSPSGAIDLSRISADFLNKVGDKPDAVTEAGFKSAVDGLESELGKGLKELADKKLKDGETAMYQVGGAVRVMSFIPKAPEGTAATELASHARKIKVSYNIDGELKKKLKDNKYTPTSSELSSLIAGVKQGCESLKKRKADKKFNAATRDKLIGYINASFAKSGEAGEADRKEQNGKVKMVQSAYATAAGLDTVLTNLQSKVYSARLDYVAAALAFGKEEEKD